MKHPYENKHKKIGNNVGYNRDDPSKTRESQQQKCENAISIAIIVNEDAFNAEDDDDSNKTNYKTNET